MISHPPARDGVRDQVSPPSPLSGPSIPIDDNQDDSMSTKNHVHSQTRKVSIERDRYQITIDILPDDILLCIFKIYMKVPYRGAFWYTLVHVCRRWRALVFGSPHHLNLHLFCSAGTPVPAMVDIWPAFPIFVYQYDFREQKLDNLIEVFKHHDRVCKIDFRSPFDKGQLKKIVSVMEVPFPALTYLRLTLDEWDRTVPVLPNLFLGGSAPRLQHFELDGFSFRRLPDLLLSATGLVSLELRRIPHSWYISPNAMVTLLSALTRLKSLTLEFNSRRYRPGRGSRHSPPPTRTLIPALTLLRFMGVYEYAEDLMAQIDTPLLRRVYITFFNETVPDIPHLSQFINRIQKFPAFDDARITISENEVRVTIRTIGYERLALGIAWDGSFGHVTSLARLCRSLLPALAMVEKLYIYEAGLLRPLFWPGDVWHSNWLGLLHLFTGTKNLYLSVVFAPCFAAVLRQLVGERATEVLPALQNLFLGDAQRRPYREGIETFVAERELSGHPINFVLCSHIGKYGMLP